MYFNSCESSMCNLRFKACNLLVARYIQEATLFYPTKNKAKSWNSKIIGYIVSRKNDIYRVPQALFWCQHRVFYKNYKRNWKPASQSSQWSEFCDVLYTIFTTSPPYIEGWFERQFRVKFVNTIMVVFLTASELRTF